MIGVLVGKFKSRVGLSMTPRTRNAVRLTKIATWALPHHPVTELSSNSNDVVEVTFQRFMEKYPSLA